ncbi:CPBP family intramembrane metalloprotease [Candidatus Woesebacteria bacterium]|nr:CPBP family intramembrane metalloprotease [Candidatus Woesebacteria bacterium]
MNPTILIIALILPILLIQIKVFPYKFRFIAHLIGFLFILFLIIFYSYTPYDLGIRFDNFAEGIIPYSLITATMSFALIIYAKITKQKTVKHPFLLPHFQYGFLILSILQELIYRGLLIPVLVSANFSFIATVITSSTIFAYLHIIYPNSVRNVFFSFILGIFYAVIYLTYPNLILISISHAVLNFLALYYQLVGPIFNKKKE